MPENEEIKKAWSESYRHLSNGNYRTVSQKVLFDQAIQELAAEDEEMRDA